ncbi:MAG: FAD-binding oxidoreductase [Deltaproteobacteria bacterium]|nr:FAD-binding oxidoreductase [Deltaproteobacteria bacterium]
MASASPSWVARCRPPRGDAADVVTTSDPERLASYLSDAARVSGGHSPAVSFPASEAAVAALLAANAPVLVVGAQSSLTGGATPRGEHLLSTARLTAIGPVAPGSVTVASGAVLADLARTLAAHGQWYPPMPTYDGATVGGSIATNAAGAATFKYGATRAWVRALTVVLADGGVLEIARGEVTASPAGHFEIVAVDGASRRLDVPAYRMPAVRKLAAGYYAAPGMDLVDMFVGAEGTLGVVTSATLAVGDEVPAWFVALVPCRSEAAALALADDLRRAAAATAAAFVDVAAVEWLDARSLGLVRTDAATARLASPLPPDAASAVLLQVALPPELDAGTAAAHVARAHDPTSDTMLGRLCRLLERHGALADAVPALPGDDAGRERLFALREAVPQAVNRLVGQAQRALDPTLAKSGGDLIVPAERLAELVERARAELAARDLDHAIWGHLSDGNLHPNVLPRRAGDGARAAAAQLAIGRAAIALGGSPLSEHGVGRHPVKQTLLRALYGDAGVAAMRRLKRALDPRGILAPGVIFPSGSV